MVHHFLELKARLTWNGVRHDVQRRFGFPIATILLTWLGVWLAAQHVSTARQLDFGASGSLHSYLGWTALLFFLAWITLPVIIFPLDENLDPQQLAVLPISGTQMIKGLAAASLVAPATLVPIAFLFGNGIALSRGWWMLVPASVVYMGLLTVGSQLFSAAISAILRSRRGRNIATLVVLGLAAGSFLIYRTVSQSISSLGLADAAAQHSIMDWSLLTPPIATQRAMIEAASGNPLLATVFLTAAVEGHVVMAFA